jgi:predicted N-acetyltransferase YhbS
MNIVIEENLAISDSNSLFKLSDSIFPEEGKEFTWEKPSHHIVARENDVAIAHIGLGKYVVSGEAETAVIGAGGVVVRRECQGQGILSLLFDVLHTTTTLNARNSATALFCPRRLVSYYERFGYREYKAGVRFLQNSRYIETPLFCFMVRGLSGLRGQLEIPSGPW